MTEAPKPRGRPRYYTDEERAAAIDAVLVRHLTPAAAARECGMSERTLKKWVADARKQPPVATPAETPPEPLAPTQAGALKPTGDSIADARAIQARLYEAAEEAAQLGNTAEARKNLQEAIKLASVIARLERERDREKGTVITPEDIAAAKKSVQDQIDALRRRPLMCAKCHRELSLEVAQNGSDE